MPATLKSRFPEIIAELRPRVGKSVAEGAALVSERASQRVPDRTPLGEGLIAAIHVEREEVGEYSVVAGDEEAFYGHIVEFGGKYSAPHPFLVPALEESTDDVLALVTAALRGL